MNNCAMLQQPSKLKTVPGRAKRAKAEEWDSERTDLEFFRAQTTAIIRHFFEIASQIGRLPSILGREFFRAKVSHHAIPSFEEQAVFVHDVERALNRLNECDAEIVALVGLFHFTLDDVAEMLGRSRSGVAKRYRNSIDQLAEIFLESRLLRDDRPDRDVRRFPGAREAGMRGDLPPKKPAASIPVEMYHFVGVESGGLSIAVRPQEDSERVQETPIKFHSGESRVRRKCVLTDGLKAVPFGRVRDKRLSEENAQAFA